MEHFTTWYVLPVAFILDLIIGDPQFFPHPVRWMGKMITRGEPFFRKLPVSPMISGGIFAVILIGFTWAFSTIVLTFSHILHPLVKTGMEILMLYYCISIRSLHESAMNVYHSLKQRRLQEAQKNVSLIVGRDVEKLTESGVIRAAVETVAENLVDGVISPLFFAVIGGAPLAMAYKMINTLDSMIGYKNTTYQFFGKIAARIDDAANFIPARLSVIIIASAAQLLSQRGKHAFLTGIKEGSNHTSPNSGYPEAAFAGTFQIRLGGPNFYGGTLVSKPYIGRLFGDVIVEDIKKSSDLMMLSSLLWFIAIWSITLINMFII